MRPGGLRWVHQYRDRNGRVRFYLRRKGKPSIPILGKPGTAEFSKAYAAAVAASLASLPRVGEITLPEGAHIYFVQAGDFIKIGFSENVGKRLIALRVGSPVELTLLVAIPGSVADERRLHKQFAAARAEGEWFHATPSLLSFVASKQTKREQPLAMVSGGGEK